MYFTNLFKNIRFYVLLFSAFLSLGIFLFVKLTVPEGTIQTIKLTQFYALTAVTYLYIALLATPLIRTFTTLPFRGHYVKARRGIGVSAFYFASLHAYFAFFKQLGGFEGLGFLTNTYLLAITLSATALLILSLMALTSFDFMVKKLTYKRWKLLHRCVYVAGIFILIHAVMLGTHFQNLSGLIPQILWVALAFLFILEALRVDRYLQTRYPLAPRIGVSLFVISVVIFSSLLMVLFPSSSNGVSFNIHSQHLQLARDAQSTTTVFSQSTKNPSLQGDPKKRYTVSFLHNESVEQNTPTKIRFQIFDASNGEEVSFFKVLYTKPFHLIVVNSSLDYYQHLHPTPLGSTASIDLTFPQNGVYHLYLDFQPVGAIEQQFAFSLSVGNVKSEAFNEKQATMQREKRFGEYEVSLQYTSPLKSDAISVGDQKLTFFIRNAETKKPVTTLRPYLGSFGHMVMINTKTYEYIHVHPTLIQTLTPDATGGPEVIFLPLGIHGPIKPGIYKVFTQLNPDNKLMLTDFFIEVKN